MAEPYNNAKNTEERGVSGHSPDGRAPGQPLSPEAAPLEAGEDATLRPKSLAAFIGQSRLKENLQITLEAARRRREPLDHVLFCGPPGLGKTTLAAILAAEMGVQFHSTSGPAIEKAGDLAALLTNLKEGDCLFIDEIHRLNRAIEEILYPSMEDFQLDIIVGEGPSARSIKLPLERFTLIGATTRTGLLTGPLRDRFGLVTRLEHYSNDELAEIVTRSARVIDIVIDAGGAAEIARRSRGTPRITNRLLRRVRDFAQVRAGGSINREVADQALALLEIDPLGLDRLDRQLLGLLITKYGGGPVGLDTIAAALGEEPDTLEDVYEPYLLQQGFLDRTPRGRVATPGAYAYLGVEAPMKAVMPLFDRSGS